MFMSAGAGLHQSAWKIYGVHLWASGRTSFKVKQNIFRRKRRNQRMNLASLGLPLEVAKELSIQDLVSLVFFTVKKIYSQKTNRKSPAWQNTLLSVFHQKWANTVQCYRRVKHAYIDYLCFISLFFLKTEIIHFLFFHVKERKCSVMIFRFPGDPWHLTEHRKERPESTQGLMTLFCEVMNSMGLETWHFAFYQDQSHF